MAFELILEFMLLLTWTVLSDTPSNQKHFYFINFITSSEVLEQLFAIAALDFAPGLFNVLRAATPPTISWFKRLPTEAHLRWAVYAVVLEKANCRPKVYMGSGTHSRYGVSRRLNSYTHGTLLPHYVQKALENGYVISHKGLLCWSAIPTPASQPMIRLLFLILEATFAYLFWVMRTPRGGDFGMAHICPWNREDFEYDGLCSHCSLNEVIYGDFDLSAEELEAQAAELKKRRNAAEAVKRAKNRVHRRQWVKENSAAHKANKTYSCATCRTHLSSKVELDIHLKTRSHTEREENWQTKPLKCYPCYYATDRQDALDRHCKSKRHLKNVEEDPLSSSMLD